MDFLKKLKLNKVSHEKLQHAAALSAGVALLVGIAAFLGVGSIQTQLALNSQSLTASTALGLTQAVPSYSVIYPYSTMNVIPGYPHPRDVFAGNSSNQRNHPNIWDTPNGGAVDGALSWEYGQATPKATPVPIAVFSVHPSGVMQGTTKRGWYRDPGYGYSGLPPAGQPYSDAGCQWDGKTIAYWSSVGPQGAGCYATRPANPANNVWGWIVDSTIYSTGVTVAPGDPIAIEWVCQPGRELYRTFFSNGNVTSVFQDFLYFNAGSGIFLNGSQIGGGYYYGEITASAPSAGGTYNYSVTCYSDDNGAGWTGNIPGSWTSILKGDDLTMTIPVTVTAAPVLAVSLTPAN
ncbi:MAG: hypothetical protein AAB449_02795, partial [Patescibacteria group bacterium]